DDSFLDSPRGFTLSHTGPSPVKIPGHNAARTRFTSGNSTLWGKRVRNALPALIAFCFRPSPANDLILSTSRSSAKRLCLNRRVCSTIRNKASEKYPRDTASRASTSKRSSVRKASAAEGCEGGTGVNGGGLSSNRIWASAAG